MALDVAIGVATPPCNGTMDSGDGNDTIHVGAGNNVLTGGSGNDTFVFAADLGKDVVTDFAHGDTIEFDHVFQNFQAVLAASHQVGADTVIAVDAQHALQHVELNSLHASDFHLVEGRTLAICRRETAGGWAP